MGTKSEPMIGVRLLFSPGETRFGDEAYACVYEELTDEGRARVRFTPPIPGWKYSQDKDIASGFFAPRYRGKSLASVSADWPLTVNLFIPIPDPSGAVESLEFVDIGELSVANRGATEPHV
jgi:hypothetical protein